MRKIEIHCIPKAKRKLMNLLDEDEKKLQEEEDKYNVTDMKEANPGQIMHALSFLSFLGKK